LRWSCADGPNWLLLIFGGLCLPGIGPASGAIAMLIYCAVGSLAYAWYLWSHRGVPKPTLGLPRLSLGPAMNVLRIGGMSAIVGSATNLTLAIVTAYLGLHGVQALAGYGAGSRLEFLLIPLSDGIGGPVGIIVSTNLGAGYVERAVQASWLGVLIAFACTEAISVTAALYPAAWIGLFSGDPQVIAVGSDYLRIVGPLFGFFWRRLRPLLHGTGHGSHDIARSRRPDASWRRNHLDLMFKQSVLAGTTHTFADLCGRSPRSVEDWLRDNIVVFVAKPNR